MTRPPQRRARRAPGHLFAGLLSGAAPQPVAEGRRREATLADDGLLKTALPDPVEPVDAVETVEAVEPVEARGSDVAQRDVVLAEIVRDASPQEFAPATPYLSRAPALFDDIKQFDPTKAVGRLNPYIDEAAASLFGVDRWCAYLEATHSAVVCQIDGRSIYDFAPALDHGRFDKSRGTILSSGVQLEYPPLRTLIAAHLARQNLMREDQKRHEEARFEGALADPGPRLVLGGEPTLSRNQQELGSPAFGFLLGACGPVDDRPVDAALRLVLAARDSGQGAMPFAGDALYHSRRDGGGAEDFAEHLYGRTAKMLAVYRAGAMTFDQAILQLPYYGIVEGHALRFMVFAGSAMASTALLLEARMSGRGFRSDLPSGAGARPGDFAPTSATGAFDAAWFEAAFEAVRRFFPDTPMHEDDLYARPYRPADLAEGLEHARDFAFAHVALAADAAGIAGDRADPESADELAFWRAGVAARPSGRCAAHGFAPLKVTPETDFRVIEKEPLGLVAEIRAKKRAAGIANPLGDVAGPLRDKVTGSDEGIPIWVCERDERGHTTTRFQRKVAKARRELAATMAARQAQGLEPMPLRPERAIMPEGWPTYDMPRQDEILQIIPLDQCKLRLKDHPRPLAAYQLEEPWFVAEARARRAAEARAKAEALASAKREALADEVAGLEAGKAKKK